MRVIRIVVFEWDESASILRTNRDKNDCQFQIIESALSDYPLIQHGWITYKLLGDPLPSGNQVIPTMDYQTFREMYLYKFDLIH